MLIDFFIVIFSLLIWILSSTFYLDCKFLIESGILNDNFKRYYFFNLTYK